MSNNANAVLCMLKEWHRVSVPQWQCILQESIDSGCKIREEYARWMLREVLEDPVVINGSLTEEAGGESCPRKNPLCPRVPASSGQGYLLNYGEGMAEYGC